MKKIILILLSALIAVSMVSGYLGEELVTCGDFTCNDEWVGLPAYEYPAYNWSWSNYDGDDVVFYATSTRLTTLTRNNCSQTIDIKIGKEYNVTIFVNVSDSVYGDIGFNFYLGGVNQTILYDTQPRVIKNDVTYSYKIIPVTIDDLFLEGTSNSGGYVMIDSISVKEIIPPQNIIVRYEDDTATIPFNYIERFDDGSIEISVPKNIFKRIFRWIANLAP